MLGYPVMQVLQYNMPPCNWVQPPIEPIRQPSSAPAPFSTRVKKYVIWCLISGCCSCILGAMFLGVYFLLRSYTSTVGYFETVPTFVPATLLILTGLCIISLAKRRNRYSFLIKLSGVCGLASALICALVTVTTTVLHMSRLQALRECEYSTKAKTCTCYSTTIEPQLENDGDIVTFVFDSTSDCGLVHGALYSCLRAIFGLSVAGVLVAVFSCMLVYQLLSHERKKMYWEQLELRCRSLYESQQAPTPLPPNGPGPPLIGTQLTMNTSSCRCCEQCHTHRQSMPPSGIYPWDDTNRFWTSGGQPRPLGNYYSPNPGGHELTINGMNDTRNISHDAQRNDNNRGRWTSGWSWPRMPWQRNNTNRNNMSNIVNDQNSRLFHQSPASPDSQYGFFSNPPGQGCGAPTDGNAMITNILQVSNQQASYSIIGGLPYGVWGPPPPYSDPNSPARRGRYQYMQQNQFSTNMDPQMQPTQQQIPNLECHEHRSSMGSHSLEPGFCSPQNRNMIIKQQCGFKTKENYININPSDNDRPDQFSNTLPVRKMKKRIEVGSKSIGPNINTNETAQRVNVHNLFQPIRHDIEEPEYPEPRNTNDEPSNSPTNISSKSSSSASTQSNCQQTKMKRVKIGVENSSFQNAEIENIKNNGIVKIMEPSTKSEIYFADVSSCCNISVKNDNYYVDAHKRRIENDGNDDESSSAKEENEDYLSQRFGEHEHSISSRLPFSQIISSSNEKYDKNPTNLPIITSRQSLIPKDLSRQSMCSVESGEKTDYTDLSPLTPCSNISTQVLRSPQPSLLIAETIESSINTNFVPSYPFSSNEQSQEAYRRSTKNIHDLFLASDAQFEIVNDSKQCEIQSFTMAFENEINVANNNSNINNINTKSLTTSHSHSRSHRSSTNFNLTPINRTNLGTNNNNNNNITSIIQNLSSSDSASVYAESQDQENDLNAQQLQQQQQQSVIATALSNSDNESYDSSDRRL